MSTLRGIQENIAPVQPAARFPARTSNSGSEQML